MTTLSTIWQLGYRCRQHPSFHLGAAFDFMLFGDGQELAFGGVQQDFLIIGNDVVLFIKPKVLIFSILARRLGALFIVSAHNGPTALASRGSFLFALEW